MIVLVFLFQVWFAPSHINAYATAGHIECPAKTTGLGGIISGNPFLIIALPTVCHLKFLYGILPDTEGGGGALEFFSLSADFPLLFNRLVLPRKISPPPQIKLPHYIYFPPACVQLICKLHIRSNRCMQHIYAACMLYKCTLLASAARQNFCLQHTFCMSAMCVWHACSLRKCQTRANMSPTRAVFL